MSDTALTSFLGSCLDLLQTSLEVKEVYASHVVKQACNEGQPGLCSETTHTPVHTQNSSHTLSQSECLFRY